MRLFSALLCAGIFSEAIAQLDAGSTAFAAVQHSSSRKRDSPAPHRHRHTAVESSGPVAVPAYWLPQQNSVEGQVTMLRGPSKDGYYDEPPHHHHHHHHHKSRVSTTESPPFLPAAATKDAISLKAFLDGLLALQKRQVQPDGNCCGGTTETNKTNHSTNSSTSHSTTNSTSTSSEQQSQTSQIDFEHIFDDIIANVITTTTTRSPSAPIGRPTFPLPVSPDFQQLLPGYGQFYPAGTFPSGPGPVTGGPAPSGPQHIIHQTDIDAAQQQAIVKATVDNVPVEYLALVINELRNRLAAVQNLAPNFNATLTTPQLDDPRTQRA